MSSVAVRPQVSVVIPSWEQPEAFLRESLSSLLSQSLSEWEALLVDDGSSDPGPPTRVVSELADPRVHFIRFAAHRGVAAARNVAITESRADLIASLDADDRFDPNYLELTVSLLRNRPDVDWVLTDFRAFWNDDPDGSEVWRFLDPLPAPCPMHFTIGTPGVMRRRVWATVGGYSEDRAFFGGGEDIDFWLGAVERGIRHAHIDQPLYWVRQHVGSTGRTQFPQYQYLVNRAIRRRHTALFEASPQVCSQCRLAPRGRVRDYLATGYFNSARAVRARGRVLRGIWLAFQGFLRRPMSRRSLTELAHSVAPGGRTRRRFLHGD
jgi:glycosyltransferase involved in cell wall biosynthesis